jgi:hypothetical protein
VTKLESSDARNNATLAISPGSATRRASLASGRGDEMPLLIEMILDLGVN